MIRKTLLTLAVGLMISSSQSHAMNSFCTDDALNISGDKISHASVSGMIGAASRSVIADPWIAFGVALLPGLHRELFHPNACFSKEDMAYNIIGAGLGVTGTHVFLGKNKIIFTWEC